jgi:hypothetical protein
MGQILHGSATTTEAIVVALPEHTLLPLDNCLYALQATIPHRTHRPGRIIDTRTNRIHGVASYLLMIGSSRAFGMRSPLCREIDALDIADEGEFRAHAFTR